MCGIAGLFNQSSNIEHLKFQAEQMSEKLEHRGPNSSGVWCNGDIGIALSHRRLAIQDLSPEGFQPMVSDSGKSVLTFNGEIYNFKAMKAELIKSGVTFTGESDTEVLLNAIDVWGIYKALDMAVGMFAFCHIDLESGMLTLARDRIGEKPLFYGVKGSTLFFASELKALYAIYPPSNLTLNYSAIDSYLRFGYFSAPNTVFEEVKRLAPGFVFQVNTKSPDPFSCVQLSEFWSVRKIKESALNHQFTSEKLAIDEGDKLLTDIVLEQSIADVSLGAFLSGGIDSTLTSAILQHNSNLPIETFTVGFPQKEFDEAGYAKEISKHLGSQHSELYIGPSELLEGVAKISKTFDEPFADSSVVPMLLVSEFAKSSVTVCLSGDGGDELFCGYNRYFMGNNAKKFSSGSPKLISSLLSSMVRSVPPATISGAYQLYKRLLGEKGSANFGVKVHKLAGLLNLSDPQAIYRYLSSYWQDPHNLLLSEYSREDMFAEFDFNGDFMDEAMLWDQLYYLPGDNLVKGDICSMSNSLELRVPLLDKRFIEYAWRLPASMKYRNGKSKWILREILYKYVPKKLIERPKMGFSVPVSKWINDDLRDWVEHYLDVDYLANQGVFDVVRVQEELRQHNAGERDNGNKLWAVLMFQVWYDSYVSSV